MSIPGRGPGRLELVRQRRLWVGAQVHDHAAAVPVEVVAHEGGQGRVVGVEAPV